jgi:GDP-L-fucose synthase
MKILITGSNGYIAKSLYSSFSKKYDVTTISRGDFDLTDFNKTKEWFSDKYFNTVIHTAISGGSRLKEDDISAIHSNLSMYYNLFYNKSHFGKLINFGSGAEIHAKETPYGFSKHLIRNSVLSTSDFYNLRIYGVFDENELDTRFIKGNILRYINRQPMQIYEDKRMSFFHMSDLVSVVDEYIMGIRTRSEIDCTYDTSYKLSEIVEMINSLSDYKVEIRLNSDVRGVSYNSDGEFNDVLKERIVEVYEKLGNMA